MARRTGRKLVSLRDFILPGVAVKAVRVQGEMFRGQRGERRRVAFAPRRWVWEEGDEGCVRTSQ